MRELSRLPLFNQPYEQDITGDRNQTLECEYNNPRNVEGGQELRRKTGNPNNHKPEKTKEETLHDLGGSNRVLSIHGEKSDINPRSIDLTRIRLQFVVYFLLHRGKCPVKGGRMASPQKDIHGPQTSPAWNPGIM